MKFFEAWWLVVVNWGDPEFRRGFNLFKKDWDDFLVKRAQQAHVTKKLVPPAELADPSKLRKSRTDEFHFGVLQEGEQRNKERKGTAWLTSDQIQQDLE